jgi:hypothetical protein
VITTGPRRTTAVPGLLAAALVSGLVLAGCGAAPPTSGAGGPGAPPTAPSSPAAPPPAPAGAPAATPAPEAVQLPWPARTAADATALQAEVDRGAQPWLLDPSEVAIAYAAAAHGWPDAEAYPGPDGTSVDVRNADGERLVLTLAQPARRGDDGIWVVTAEHR